MPDIIEVADRVFMIDSRLFSIRRTGSVYFLDEEKTALIDTGPSTSSDIVLEGIKKIGRRPEDVSYLILTHIHLDHGGGAGTLLKHMPSAQVVVHHKASRHVINPEKLVKGAGDAQGKKWIEQIGEVLPIEQQRVIAVHDGDKIELGTGQVLTLLETPGHAPHELCIHESRNNGVFVGDAISHNVSGTDISIPMASPPSFDTQLYIDSLNRLLGLNPGLLYFPHFGISRRPAHKIKLAIKEMLLRDEMIARAAEEDKLDSAYDMAVERAREVLKPIARDMKEVYDYWLEYDIPMSTRAHVRHYSNRSEK